MDWGSKGMHVCKRKRKRRKKQKMGKKRKKIKRLPADSELERNTQTRKVNKCEYSGGFDLSWAFSGGNKD